MTDENLVEKIKQYLDIVCLGVPNDYTRFLVGEELEEDNRFRYARIAYALMDYDDPALRDKKFEEILQDIEADIDSEILHDGPDIMNICGILDAIEENKEAIYRMADNFPERLKEGRQYLVDRNIGEYENLGYIELFEELIGTWGECPRELEDDEDGMSLWSYILDID